jgi:predicted TPR repeat methyltransferase
MSQLSEFHDSYASSYDRQAREYHCFVPEILFGLVFEYVKPGERLLDAGIGTGLSAAPFAKAGLKVYGIDVSPEMLNACRSKGIALELKQWDLSATPWPYAPGAFDHVVSCGLLHFLEGLEPVFSEAVRVTRAGGTFTFTTKAPPAGSTGVVRETIDGMQIFSHSPETVQQLLRDHELEALKEARVLVGNERDQPDGLFRAYITRKKE